MRWRCSGGRGGKNNDGYLLAVSCMCLLVGGSLGRKEGRNQARTKICGQLKKGLMKAKSAG